MEFSTEHLLWATALGALSAISLPLGSLLGLTLPPRARVTGAATAFGAGALLAALTVELVAPTAMHAHTDEHGAAHLVNMLIGCVVGGSLFVTLDQLVNQRGGFLRKSATTITYLSRSKAKRDAVLLEQLSKVEILHAVPPEHIDDLVEAVRPVTYHADEILFREGEEGHAMYFVVSGALDVIHDGHVIKQLGPGDVLGEIALVADSPRTATVKAHNDCRLLQLGKDDFAVLRDKDHGLMEAAAKLASDRLHELKDTKAERAREAVEWAENAAEALRLRTEIPTPGEIRKASEGHGGAPLAIWLGILLDGVPESFVIGSSMVAVLAAQVAAAGGDIASVGFMDVMPWTLIAGLFLSNFPEAMSSSVGMRTQGWSAPRTFMMWFSLVIVTAGGAALGYAVGGSAGHGMVIAVEGLAAGAMLTMIASTMVPEAIHLSGPTVTGLATLAGFLGAVAFKLLEG